MKKLILLGLVVIMFAGCQQEKQRFFTESAEIDVLKAGIAAYESADWDKWRSHFADTAKIYVNSSESISVDKRVEGLKGMASSFSSYGFDHSDEFIEMVLDKEYETWVYYWAEHNGTIAANNKKLSIPVHLAVQFVDSLIVEEHVYFDGTELNAALAEIAAAAKTPAEDNPEN